LSAAGELARRVFSFPHMLRESLTNSGTVGLRDEMDQVKERIADNSRPIGKIRNAEMSNFSRKTAFHELVRGSLVITDLFFRTYSEGERELASLQMI